MCVVHDEGCPGPDSRVPWNQKCREDGAVTVTLVGIAAAVTVQQPTCRRWRRHVVSTRLTIDAVLLGVGELQEPLHPAAGVLRSRAVDAVRQDQRQRRLVQPLGCRTERK